MGKVGIISELDALAAVQTKRQREEEGLFEKKKSAWVFFSFFRFRRLRGGEK